MFYHAIHKYRELQQIALNHSSAIEFFMKLYVDFTKEKFSFSVKDTTLPSDNPLRFKKMLFENDCYSENQNNW